MTIKKLSNEKPDSSTGRWYPNHRRINVSAQIADDVPWESGIQLVILYDSTKDELKIKPLSYK